MDPGELERLGDSFRVFTRLVMSGAIDPSHSRSATARIRKS